MKLWLAILCLGGLPLTQQEPTQPSPPDARVESEQANRPLALDERRADGSGLKGLTISPNVLRLALIRFAGEVSLEYGLDDEQSARAQESALRRWLAFAEEKQDVLQPLFNEFMEMRLELEPPAKEKVQAWAERTRPVFEAYAEEVREAMDDFRELLSPEQRLKFERDALQFNMGLEVAAQSLRQWEQGQYNERVFWDPPSSNANRRREARERRIRQREERDAQAAAEAEKPDVITEELDAWQRYAEEFMAFYDLNEGQRDAARSFLKELTQRANDHRERRREDIRRLEERIAAHTGDEDELAAIARRLEELYGPIDDMFRELQRRIGQLPSAEQRARALERGRREGRQPPDAEPETNPGTAEPTTRTDSEPPRPGK